MTRIPRAWFLLPIACFAGLLLVPLAAEAQRGRQYGPQIVREWRCSRCKGLLGQGDVRPSMDLCTHCRSRLRSGWGSNTSRSTSPSTTPSSSRSEPVFDPNFLRIALSFMVFVGVVGGFFWVVNRKGDPGQDRADPT